GRRSQPSARSVRGFAQLLAPVCGVPYIRSRQRIRSERSTMRKRFGVGAALVALAAAAIALAVGIGSGSAAKSSAYKVAWIYVGTHNDHGWSQAHDQGRLYVQQQLGSKVQTTYKENIANGPELKQTVASLV